MRTEDLLDAIGGVDDELLQRSEKVKIKKTNSWKVWVPLAACLCLVLGLRFLVFPNGFMMKSANDTAAESVMDSWGVADGEGAPKEEASCDGIEAFGNVYALSMSEANEFIYANREVAIEIRKLESESSIEIEDCYTIFNRSSEDLNVEFAYMYNMDHNGTPPVFVDEDGNEIGKAGIPIQVTIPANGHLTISGQYNKSAESTVEFIDYYIHGCRFTNLDIKESFVTINRDGNIETIQIDPIEDYYLD